MTTRKRPPAGTEGHQSDRDEALQSRVRDTEDMAELLRRVLATDRPDFERGWRNGYRRGYESGWDVGYARARIELDEQWRAMAERVVRLSAGRTLADLRELRDLPTGETWQRWRERHGGEHLGGPVDYETGRPLRAVDGGAA